MSDDDKTEWPSALSRKSWMNVDEIKKREIEGLEEEKEEEEEANKKQKLKDDKTEEESPEKDETSEQMFLKGLVDKEGTPVTVDSLKGKIVLLYFSSSWCPGCVAFTPMLSVLFEDDEEDTFAVVYVSSDSTAEQCEEYYKKKHADWFLLPYETESEQRSALKKKYGVFAGKEQPNFPDTARKSGIPTLVVVDKKGECLDLLDCDDPKVHKELQSKGTDFLKQWEAHAWD